MNALNSIRKKKFKLFCAVSMTFLIGMLLTILPLPEHIVWYRPAWVWMILVFWLLVMPERIGVVFAFFLGLMLDLLTGTPLGLHALAFSLVAYFMVKFHTQMRVLPSWQFILMILVLMLGYMALLYWVLVLFEKVTFTWRYWLPVFTTTLVWPLAFQWLHNFWGYFKEDSFRPI